MMFASDEEWDRAARAFAEGEVAIVRGMSPPGQPCIIRWHGGHRVGAIAELRADGVCLLALGTSAVRPAFLAALRRVDPARLEYEADSELDLTGRQHIVARDGDRVRRLDPEQTRWAQSLLSTTRVVELGGGGLCNWVLRPPR